MAIDPPCENSLPQRKAAAPVGSFYSGFTLIEVLSAMAILLVIMLAMGRIYASVTKGYQESLKQVERDAGARAVMDYIAREISMSVFENPNVNTGALLSMRYKANTFKNNFGLEGADELWLVSGSNSSESNNPRHTIQVVYYVTNSVSDDPQPTNAQYRYRLQRGFYNTPSDSAVGGVGAHYDSYLAGSNGLDWSVGAPKPGTARPMIDNIRTFEVFVYTNSVGGRALDWNSMEKTSLFCIDLYLETMGEADAIRAAQLAASLGQSHERTVTFVESAVRRHYQRVYFPNKMAYYDQPFL